MVEPSIIVPVVLIIIIAITAFKAGKIALKIIGIIACVFLAIQICKPEWIEPFLNALKSVGNAIVFALRDLIITIAPEAADTVNGVISSASNLF